MQVVFICPFDVDRLTGTPIRTKHTISAVSQFAKVSVIANGGEEVADKNIQINVLRKNNIFLFTFHTLRELKKIKPTILHGVSTLSMLPILLYKLFLNRKCKIIFDIHGWSWYETENVVPLYKRIFFLMIDYVGLISAHRIISMSFSQELFLKRIKKQSNVYVIWGAADFFANYEKVPERPVFKIGYLGNRSFWQGLDVVFKTAELYKDKTEIVFEIGGFKIDDSLNLPKQDNIVYSGIIKRSDVRSFICDKDVMVSPRIKGSVSDLQYPQKISEYLMCGRPVIVSDVSDQARIVNEARCGIVLHDVTSSELYTAINIIYNKNKEERFAMGIQAANFAAKEFSIDSFRHKIALVYQGI